MPDDYQPKPRRLWLAALVFCVVVIADSCFRWATYQYRTFDLAFYVQSFWLSLHGQSHSTILDVSLMGNHAEPICFVLMRRKRTRWYRGYTVHTSFSSQRSSAPLREVKVELR